MPLPSDPTFGCRYAPSGPELRTLLQPPVIPANRAQLLRDEAQRQVNAQLPPGASAQHILFPYLKYDLTTDYLWNSNTIKLPVAKKAAKLERLGGSKSELKTPGFIGSNNPPAPPAFSPTPQAVGIPSEEVIQTPQYGQLAPQQASGSGATVPDTAASNRPAAKIIQVGAPTGEKIVRFEIARLGAQPEIPDPTPRNENEVLAFSRVQISAPQPSADGNDFVWSAVGVYVYHLSQPYWASDGYVGGSTPVDNTTLQQNWYSSGQYADDLA